MTKGYHQLTYEQRCQLYILNKRGDAPARIAVELGIHRSTVYRELIRNRGKRGYRYKQAHSTATQRRLKVSCQRTKITPELLNLIEEKLALKWSPEQISGWLKKQGKTSVSHETIYKHIWEDKRRGGDLFKHLRHRGKKYNKRGKSKAGRGCIPNRIDIDQRPEIVKAKCRLGDWELDTIIGKGHKGAIVSIVDRASKLVKLQKVSRKTADEVTDAIVDKLHTVKDFVMTLTADNGKEFANHELISRSLDGDFFFATPYHSWERGLNEHTNGLVRQYFPKWMKFDEITQEQIDEVEILLNNRPRKVLEYSTPIEMFQRRRNQTPICRT